MPVQQEGPSFPPAFDIRVAFGPAGSLSGRFGGAFLDEDDWWAGAGLCTGEPWAAAAFGI